MSLEDFSLINSDPIGPMDDFGNFGQEDVYNNNHINFASPALNDGQVGWSNASDELTTSPGYSSDPYLFQPPHFPSPIFSNLQPFTRRRSQSQPPSFDHTDPLISPLTTMSPSPFVQPALVRSINPRKIARMAKGSKTDRKGRAQQQIQRSAPRLAARPVSDELKMTGSKIAKRKFEEMSTDMGHGDRIGLMKVVHLKISELQNSIAILQEYLQHSGEDCHCGPHHSTRCEIESKRIDARKANHQICGLEERLTPLPAGAFDSRVGEFPRTAADVRGLDHKAIDNLFFAYDVSYNKDLLLYQKKALFLQFVGISKSMMHKVLD